MLRKKCSAGVQNLRQIKMCLPLRGGGTVSKLRKFTLTITWKKFREIDSSRTNLRCKCNSKNSGFSTLWDMRRTRFNQTGMAEKGNHPQS